MLDPFGGAEITRIVAQLLSRGATLIELNRILLRAPEKMLSAQSEARRFPIRKSMVGDGRHQLRCGTSIGLS
jgi:DNA modification methylase